MYKAQEVDRMRTEYAAREQRLAGGDLYSCLNPANLFILQSRQRAVLGTLRGEGFDSLANYRILELGCGNGGVLLEFLSYGVVPKRLHGTDLLFQRVAQANERASHLPLICANGECLPYAPNSFDLVLQFTVFTSILDSDVRAHVASEMLRVLQKPHGVILWYDFWINPTNKQTRGIRPGEIRKLFPGCSYTFRKITLAPPIARRTVPVSWILASILEKMGIFNSHYLVLIQPL